MPITSFKSGTKSRSMLVGNTYYEPGSYYSIATTTLSTSAATITLVLYLLPIRIYKLDTLLVAILQPLRQIFCIL